MTSNCVSSNQRTYERRDIVERYLHSDALYPAESAIFRRFDSQFKGRVLDIAVGTGRTTGALQPNCARYVGLDFSQAMIAAARRSWPSADLRVMDMREVPKAFVTERFDAILISFNAIDYVPWEDRCSLLEGLRTLLAADGVIVFSSHNIAGVARQKSFRLREDLRIALKTAYRPRSLARFVLRTPPWMLIAWRNRRRNRRLEVSRDGYAYVNDGAEDYGLLTVYVQTSRQLEVLKEIGFSRLDVIQPWLETEAGCFDYYVCQC